MPTITITNQVASQALRGENVKITVNLATQSAEFSQLEIGQLCANSSGGAQGLIYSIDTYGNSFEIAPISPNLSMQNANLKGYVGSSTNISVTV